MKIDGWMVAFALVAQGCSEAREQVVDVGDTAADAVTTMDAPKWGRRGGLHRRGRANGGGHAHGRRRGAGSWSTRSGRRATTGSSSSTPGAARSTSAATPSRTSTTWGAPPFGRRALPRGHDARPRDTSSCSRASPTPAFGPQSQCLAGGPSPCFHASWSISASRGETVLVLDRRARRRARGVPRRRGSIGADVGAAAERRGRARPQPPDARRRQSGALIGPCATHER